MATKAKELEITVTEVSRGKIEFLVRGDTPLIYHAMSQKVKEQLLSPPPKKNAAAKAASMKHAVYTEYQGTMYYARDPNSPTRLMVPATMPKAALMGAALDLPGTNKSQIGRLTYVEGTEISIYGIPQLLMSVTRSSDMNRTPDVRTRAILPEWAARVTVVYTKPLVQDQAVINLMSAAGMTMGWGDWRVQKGSGNYGQYSLVGLDDEQFNRIIETGTRAAQDEAIANPEPYDEETRSLLAFYDAEVRRRGFQEVG